jgi:hypothetical protein
VKKVKTKMKKLEGLVWQHTARCLHSVRRYFSPSSSDTDPRQASGLMARLDHGSVVYYKHPYREQASGPELRSHRPSDRRLLVLTR